MIDWDRPLEAYNGLLTFPVAIDRTYARSHAGEFIKFPRNIWTGDANGGTWLINSEGLAVSGISPDGYDGKYRVRNR